MINVLLFRPHRSAGGGVVEFAESLTSAIESSVHVHQFVIGARPGLLQKLFRPLVPLFDTIRLLTRSIQGGIDLYHINPSLVPRSVLRDGLFILALKVLAHRKVLVLFHGWDHDFYARICRSSLLSFWFRSTFGRADRILVLAHAFRSDLRQLGIDDSRSGVATMMFDGKYLRTAKRTHNDENFRILFLARFVTDKGIHQLLEAFSRVYEMRPNTVLILAGDGPEKENAALWCTDQGFADRVQFPGYVQRAAKAQLLRNSDLFVLPSRTEGCPVSMLEAMAAAMPIIATRTGAIPEIIESDKNGIVLETASVDDIFKAIIYYVDNPIDRQITGVRNAHLAWEQFEAGRVAVNFFDEYEALLRMSF